MKVKSEPKSPVSFETEAVDLNNNSASSPTRRKFSETAEDEPASMDKYAPKSPKRRSPLGKVANVPEELIDILQRIFPHQSRAILELIMRSSENDLVRAIESLVPDANHQQRYPTVISVRGNGGPFFPFSGQEDDGRRSAFSPIGKNGLYLSNSHKKGVRSLSAFQPVHPYSRTDINPPVQEHFKIPPHVHPYGFNRHASTALLSLSNTKHVPVTSEYGGKFCDDCGFGVKSGDKFCSECGKKLQS